MKKSLNNPTSFLLYLALSAATSWISYYHILVGPEGKKYPEMSIVLGLLIGLLPFLVIDVYQGIKEFKRFQKQFPKDLHLPNGMTVRYSNAPSKPVVNSDKLGITIDFGEGNIVIIKPNRCATMVIKPMSLQVEIIDPVNNIE